MPDVTTAREARGVTEPRPEGEQVTP
jgi:hypothetical protein